MIRLDDYRNAINKNILKGFIDNDIDLIKGGPRAAIGEKRTFGGREYIKTSDGWKYHGKGTGGSESKEGSAKKTPSFDRGEKHHSEQVVHHTKQRDMHEEIANHITSKYGTSDDSVAAAKYHREAANKHHEQLSRLEKIKSSDGLLSIGHLKVGDKFIATSNGYKEEGKQVPIKITEVREDGIVYMTDQGHKAFIDKKTGRMNGTITHTHDFSKWKPVDPNAKPANEYENMSTSKLLQTLGIENVSQTYYSAKRGTVFDRQNASISDEGVIQKIKSLVVKNGKPTKITYESADTPREEYEHEQLSEREYGYTRGKRVVFHWGDKKQVVF